MSENIIQINEGTGKKLHTFNRTIGANDVHDEVMLLGEPYLASYAVAGNPTASAGGHALQIMAGSSLKVRIRSIRILSSAATAAGSFRLGMKRLTSAGTGGAALVPVPLDPSDSACGATVMVNPTSAGTVSGEYMWLPTIQTTAAAPQPGQEQIWYQKPNQKPLIIAAGTANGIALVIVNLVAGGSFQFSIEFDESNF